MSTPERFEFISSEWPCNRLCEMGQATERAELHELNRRDVITNLLVWIAGVLDKPR